MGVGVTDHQRPEHTGEEEAEEMKTTEIEVRDV